MSGLSCKICFNAFSDKIKPRTLPCGHCCCGECLTEILDSNKECFLCRAPLVDWDVLQYPINYTLLEVAEELASSPLCIDNFKKRLQLLYKSQEEMLIVVEKSVSRFLTNINKVEKMKRNQTVLLELISKDESELNVKESIALLDDIDHLKNEVSMLFPGKCNSNSKVNFRLSQFETSNHFLLKICSQIREGKKFCIRKLIKDVEKIAEVSVRDSLICIHSFKSSSANDQCDEIEFDDIKNILVQNNISVFLEFSAPSGLCQRVLINCLPQSFSAFYFLKLCTGETGVSYLDCSLQLTKKEMVSEDRICTAVNHAISVKNLEDKIEFEDKYLKYLFMNDIMTDCCPKEYYVKLDTSGSFEISQFEGTFRNVIGISDSVETKKIHSPANGFNKVFDCGIALRLNVTADKFLCKRVENIKLTNVNSTASLSFSREPFVENIIMSAPYTFEAPAKKIKNFRLP